MSTLPVFPVFPGVTFPVKRSAKWKTVPQESISGQETRLALWSYPRWKYELSFEFLRTYGSYTEWQTMIGFINSMNGSAGVFQYYDITDSIATAQSIGTGDGTNKSFQCVRSYGGFLEPVFAPVTISVYSTVSSVITLVSPTLYTVSQTGQVVFTTAPATGAIISWTGTFNWLCRFDDDEIKAQEDMSGFWSIKSCMFSTVKL